MRPAGNSGYSCWLHTVSAVRRDLSKGASKDGLHSSGTTAALAADDLPPMSELVDLGEHRLRDLDRPEHVYQLVAPGLRRVLPPLRSISPRATNLPLEVTSFGGRERELADIARLLATSRLVSLVGVGGTGKTRLALQAAADRLDRPMLRPHSSCTTR
jgi:hypothetical protein